MSRVNDGLAGDAFLEVTLGTMGGKGSESGGSTGYVRVMWQWTRSIGVAAVLFLTVRAFGVEAFKIPTASMEGTLLVGDYLLVNKAVYGAEVPFVNLRLPPWREPDRGEVVVFHPPHDPLKHYVKRVVGIPGDTLEMRDKTLIVNGLPMQEEYVRYMDRSGDAVHSDMKWQQEFLLASGVDRALTYGEDDGRIRYPDGSSRRDYRDRYRPSRDNWGPIAIPENSYFVLGDNRDNSEDSRYWGFVDRRSIRGRPWRLYFSLDLSDKRGLRWLRSVRWDRVGKPIR